MKKKEPYHYSLLEATHSNNVGKVKLLMEKANHTNMILNINEKEKDTQQTPLYIVAAESTKLLLNEHELIDEIYNNNKENVILILKEAEQRNINLNINKKEEGGYYPLFWAVYNNDLEMVELLMDYADEHSMILNVNDKENEVDEYPLFEATFNNNVEIVKLLMEYANRNNIILTIK